MSLQHPTAVARAVFGIDEEGATYAGLAGHKAANLARLTGLGFPVPPGVVVSTDAVDRIRAEGAVPEDLGGRLTLALEELGGGPVAVRSSGAAEDLPGRPLPGSTRASWAWTALPRSRTRSCAAQPRPARSGWPPMPPGGSGTPARPGPAWPFWSRPWSRPRRPGSPSPPTRSPATGTRSWSARSGAWVSGWSAVRPPRRSGGSGTGRLAGWPGPRGPSTPRTPPGSVRWPWR